MKIKSLISLIALASCLPLLAATATQPALVQGDTPQYSEEARSMGIQGTVLVEALIDQNGRVIAAEVIHSVHPSLDSATLQAVQGWTFTPATVEGRPVMKVVQIPVTFQLVDPLENSVRLGKVNSVAAR
jgi:TonB family protein